MGQLTSQIGTLVIGLFDLCREAIFVEGFGEDGHGMHRPFSGVLLKLNCCERAVGCPDLGVFILHAVK